MSAPKLADALATSHVVHDRATLEAAILRMFSRLRAPRVENADVAWPVTPGWTTPLPSGLFTQLELPG